MSSPIWHLIHEKLQFTKYNNSGNLSESNDGASESITEKVKNTHTATFLAMTMPIVEI